MLNADALCVTDHLYFHCQYNRYNYIWLLGITLSNAVQVHTHTHTPIVTNQTEWMNDRNELKLKRRDKKNRRSTVHHAFNGLQPFCGICVVIGIDQIPKTRQRKKRSRDGVGWADRENKHTWRRCWRVVAAIAYEKQQQKVEATKRHSLVRNEPTCSDPPHDSGSISSVSVLSCCRRFGILLFATFHIWTAEPTAQTKVIVVESME